MLRWTTEQASLRISNRATGVVFADLDNDGDLDLYVASMPQPQNGLAGCSLFWNEGKGVFTNISNDNAACPPAFGGRSASVLDFDGDGLLDLLVGEDPLPGYNGSPTKSSRLFRNLGALRFEDVSRAAGLPAGIPGLGVAAADVNNDGWRDFFLASAGGGNVLFLNDGRGKFREAPGSREVFAWKAASGDNMICGVCCGDVNRDGLLDVVIGAYDNDGRLDFFLPSWWPEARFLLLHNETPGGHWLQVQVEGTTGVNRQGIGARVNVYAAGKLGEAGALLGCREISVGFGYASGQAALAHFGLGERNPRGCRDHPPTRQGHALAEGGESEPAVHREMRLC
jgi:hypothetical protein